MDVMGITEGFFHSLLKNSMQIRVPRARNGKLDTSKKYIFYKK